MSRTRRPISVTIISWILIITSTWSLLYIPLVVNSEVSGTMVQSHIIPPVFTALLGLSSGGINIAAGLGMLKRMAWGRRLYLFATPLLLLVSATVYGTELFALYLIALAVYFGFCVALTRRPVSDYFRETPNTEVLGDEKVSENDVDESMSRRKIASVLLLISAGFVLNAWFMIMLPLAENTTGMLIASLVLGGFVSALLFPAIVLWDRARWAVVTGTLLASVGSALLMFWLLLYQFTSMAEFPKEFAKIDPTMLERMTRGCLLFGLLATVVGALLIVIQREKDMESLSISKR